MGRTVTPGLSWPVGTEPEAPVSVLLVFYLCAGDSDNGQQRWVQLGVPWFPFPDSPSHSLALPTRNRKGGAGMPWPRIRARVPRFPPFSLLEPILGVLGSARDL